MAHILSQRQECGAFQQILLTPNANEKSLTKVKGLCPQLGHKLFVVVCFVYPFASHLLAQRGFPPSALSQSITI